MLESDQDQSFESLLFYVRIMYPLDDNYDISQVQPTDFSEFSVDFFCRVLRKDPEKFASVVHPHSSLFRNLRVDEGSVVEEIYWILKNAQLDTDVLLMHGVDEL